MVLCLISEIYCVVLLIPWIIVINAVAIITKIRIISTIVNQFFFFISLC